MKAIPKEVILFLAPLAAVLLVIAIFAYVFPHRLGYGITDIRFGSSRTCDQVIWVTVENNGNTSRGIVAVSVNGTKISDVPFDVPNVYPRFSNAIIAPNSRIELIIEGFDWKWSDPQGTQYFYKITLTTSKEEVIFTKSKQTPLAP